MTPPTIIPPANVSVECSADISSSSLGRAVATDNCTETRDIIVTFRDEIGYRTCENTYRIKRIWRATDKCGNTTTAVQQIKVKDSTAPVITVPGDVDLDCNISDVAPASLGIAMATDNCSAEDKIIIDYWDQIISGGCEKTIKRTWTATDECGNTSQGVQTIIVSDTIAPYIEVPKEVYLECSASTLPESTGSVLVTDNCSPPEMLTISYKDDKISTECENTYILKRTWTAVDECGNIDSVAQHIYVGDSTAPEIICPADTMVFSNTENCSAVIELNLPLISDDCNDVTLENDAPDIFLPGTTTVIWTATDNCGNSTTCTQNVTVEYCSPIALDDNSLDNDPGNDVTINILGNDKISDGNVATPQNASVVLNDPVKSPSNNPNSVQQPGEGSWTYDPATGNLTFIPEEGFTENPTPLTYSLIDISNDMTDDASVSITYKKAGGN